MDQSNVACIYRILSFDGGGIHALPYLRVLQEIEAHLDLDSQSLTGNPGLARSGRFGMLVGTSTGAIVATALKRGYSVQRVIDLYTRHAATIFNPLRIWNRFFHKYSSESLNRVLKDEFGRDLRWGELLQKEDPELVVTLWNVSSGTSAFVSTNPDRIGQDKRLWDARVADVVTACCAAPYYFPPRAFGRLQSRRGVLRDAAVYCDGGITGLNNPAALALALLLQQTVTPGARVHVLSFGAGKAQVALKPEDVQRFTVADAAKISIEALLASTSVLMEHFYEILGGRLGVDVYFRSNQVLTERSPLDDVKSIPRLLELFDAGKIEYTLAGDGADCRTQTPEEGKYSVLTGPQLRHLCDKVFQLSTPGEPVAGRPRPEPTLASPKLPQQPTFDSVESWELCGSWWRQPILVSLAVVTVALALSVIGWAINATRLRNLERYARETAEYERGKAVEAQGVAQRQEQRARLAEANEAGLQAATLSLRVGMESTALRKALDSLKLAPEPANALPGRVVEGLALAVRAASHSRQTNVIPQVTAPANAHCFIPYGPEPETYMMVVEGNVWALSGRTARPLWQLSDGDTKATKVRASADGRVVAVLHASGVIRVRRLGHDVPHVVLPPLPPNLKGAPVGLIEDLMARAEKVDGQQLPRFVDCAVSENGDLVAAWDKGGTLTLSLPPPSPPDLVAVHIPGVDIPGEPVWSPVQAAAFVSNPEAHLLALTTARGTDLWDLGVKREPTPAVLRRLLIKPAKVTRLASPLPGTSNNPAVSIVFGPGERWLWVQWDGTLTVRHGDGELVVLKDVKAQSAGFDSSGRHVVALTEEEVRLFELEENRSSPIVHPSVVTGDEPLAFAGFAGNNKSLLTVSRKGSVRMTELGQNLAGLQLSKARHKHMVQAMAFDPKASILASADKESVIKSWDVRSGSVDHRVDFHNATEAPAKMVFSPDGSYLAVLGSEGAVRVWKAGESQPVTVPSPNHGGNGLTVPTRARDLGFAAGRNELRVASGEGVLVWDLDGAKLHRLELKAPPGRPQGVSGIHTSSSPNVWAARSYNAEVWLLDALGNTGPAVQLSESFPLREIAFLGRDRFVAAGWRGDVTLFDVPGRQTLWNFTPHKARANQSDLALFLAASPDGQRFLTRELFELPGRPIRVWDQDRNMVDEWTENRGTIIATEFLTDDEVLIAYGAGDVVRWMVGTKEGEVLPGHPDGIDCLAVSPDRAQYAVAAKNGSIVVYPTSRESLAEMGQSLARRARELLAPVR